MSALSVDSRLSARQGTPPSPTLADADGATASVVDWLLHDDVVMRECFNHAVAILKVVTGAEYAAVTLLDTHHQHYLSEVGFNAPPAPRALSICEHAVAGNDVFVIEDASGDARFAGCHLVAAPWHVRFYAAIPLRAPNGEVVGALCSMGPHAQALDASQRAVFLHLRQMIENDLRLRIATAIDPLTQVFSRRFFVESIRQKWAEAPLGHTVGVGVVDVDWFKQYNDTYGHPAGDDCLRKVAAVLQGICDGERVIAGRVGGEEFGIFMNAATREELAALAEHVRAQVEALQCEHRASPRHVVTMSIGGAIACKRNETGVSHRDVFIEADRALYESKRGGRNRVTIA